MKPGIIYVDIESLLDLRQGHLGSLGLEPDGLSEYLLSETYNFRESDDLKFSSRVEYKNALKNPPTNLLENSTITHILICILRKIESIESRNKYYNETLVPEVVLNTYPFNFTEGQREHIRNLLFYKLNESARVSITYLEPLDVSPVFLKTANVVSAFIYDISEWLNYHAKALENNRIHDSLLYTPAVYVVKPTQDELSKISKLGFKDPMAYTSYLLSPSVSLNFLPVVFYSNIITAAGYLERFAEEANRDTLSDEEKPGDVDSRPTV